MDHIGIIQNHFEARKSKNASYSLRAYARDLNVSHTLLNRIFTGKGKLSVQSGSVMARKLRLMGRDLARFMDSIRLSHEKDGFLKAVITKKIALYQDQVLQISPADVEDLPLTLCILVLSAFDLPLYQKGVNSKKLIEVTESSKKTLQPVLDRLLKLKILSKNKKGQYTRTCSRWELRSDIDRTEIKRVHADFLRMANDSLEKFSPNLRFSATELIPLSEKDLTAFHELCSEFLERTHLISRETKADPTAGPGKTRMFALSMHGFPILEGADE